MLLYGQKTCCLIMGGLHWNPLVKTKGKYCPTSSPLHTWHLWGFGRLGPGGLMGVKPVGWTGWARTLAGSILHVTGVSYLMRAAVTSTQGSEGEGEKEQEQERGLKRELSKRIKPKYRVYSYYFRKQHITKMSSQVKTNTKVTLRL